MSEYVMQALVSAFFRFVLAVAIIAGVVGGLIGYAFGADPWQQMRAVVEIKVNQGRMASWTGSGTLIAKKDGIGCILSCRHVNTRQGMAVQIVWHGSGKQTSTGKPPVSTGFVTYVNPGGSSEWGTDLAIVLAPCPEHLVPVEVAEFDSSAGPWRSAGYRGGKFYVATATEAYARNSAIVTNSPFIGGMSGGVTFDKFGRQVGVVVASDRNTVGWSADGEQLKAMLKQFGR